MESMMQFGFPDEWQHFHQRHAMFFDRFSSLQRAVESILFRTIPETDLTDKMVFFLARQCKEDLMEIMLLAANGYGVGAQKLVRGMYERAVVAYYLAANPDQTDDFLNYSLMEQFKATKAWTEARPNDKRAARMLVEAQKRREEVKDRFKGKSGWSGRDFVTMAKSTGSLGTMLSEAYYRPLAFAHGTAQAVVDRLEWSETGGFEFMGESQHDEADRALMSAHKIMIYALLLQQTHFKLDEDRLAIVRQASDDFVAIWKRDVDDDDQPETGS